MKKISILMFLLSLSFVGFSQAFLQAPYINAKGQPSIQEMQTAFKTWSKDKDLSNEKGWKQFKRWEYEVVSNVDANGKLLPSRQQYMNFLEIQQMDQIKGNATWVSLNPNQVPNSSIAGINGMGRLNCITFHPTDSLTMWVGASNGGVWKTVDGGLNWMPLLDEGPSMRVSDIAVQKNNPDVMYVSTGDINYMMNSQGSEGTRNYGMGLIKSIDGGLTWDTTGLSFPLQDAYSGLLRRLVISDQDSAHLLAFGGSGTFKSTDAGATWTHVNTHVIMDVETNPLNDSVIYTSSFRLFYSGTRSKVYKSTDFGDTWVEQNVGIPVGANRTELAISASDTNIVYALAAASSFQGLYKTSNSGQTWDTVAVEDSLPNIMGHYDGGISGFFTDNGGQGYYDLALTIDPNNPNVLHAGGVNVWTSNDGGKSFGLASYWTTMLGTSIHADQHQMKHHPLTGEIFVCNDGGLVKTDTIVAADFNDVFACYDPSLGYIVPGCYQLPTQWENLTHGIHNSEHYYIGQNGKVSYDFAVGNQDNGTRIYRNGKWRFIFGGDGGKPMLNPDDTNIVFASYQLGVLCRSEDGGRTFSPSLTSNFSTNTFIAPFLMHPHNPDVIYAGLNNAYISYDRGDSWTLLKHTTYDIQDMHIPEINPYYTYLADKRFVYSSIDSGATWLRDDLPYNGFKHRLAVDFYNPDEIYVTYSGYQDTLKVFKSMDRGQTWENLTFNLPNIPVNCIEVQYGINDDGDTTNGIYIGTDMGIYFLNDSLMAANAGWQRYGNGLPNVTIYDLAINYTAQKLRAATYGRGMWEIDLYETSNGVNVSIPDNEVGYEGLKVYPNPATDQLNIVFAVPNENVQSLQIFDASAKMVYTDNAINRTDYQSNVSLSHLPEGLYFVRLQTNKMVYVAKVIKQ